MPLFGCLASMVSGYFIVYFTMLDQYVKDYHHYTDEQSDFFFTLMVASLPVGAFLGKYLIRQVLLYIIDSSMQMVKTKL